MSTIIYLEKKTFDVVVNFNGVIRIVYCVLNVESAQPVAFLTFKWTLYVNQNKYNPVLYCGYKNARLERFVFKNDNNSIT